MTNSSVPTDSCSTPNAQTQGIPKIRQKTIAAMIARGFSPKYIAKKLKMSESRIYHLLSEKDSSINSEINDILNQLFATTDRQLINLYSKALQKLDDMLSSSDEEKQYRAMDRIIKMFFARTAKNAIIQQYFCADPRSQQVGFNVDEFILNRKKERGVDKLHLDEDSDEDSSDSAPENSASPASASPTPVSETAAPNESSRGYSPPNLSAETRKFLDDMNEPPPSK